MDNEFIKVDFNTIVNVSSIESLKRIYSDNYLYSSYIEKYNQLLTDVVKTYLVEHVDEFFNEDEDTISQKLYDRFAPIVRKNVVKELGYTPDPYICTYVVRTKSGEEINVDEDSFNKLCEIIKVKLDPITQEPVIND